MTTNVSAVIKSPTLVTKRIPYFRISLYPLPYFIRLINSAFQLDLANADDQHGVVIPNRPALDAGFALALTVFPRRLIGAEVSFLRTAVLDWDHRRFTIPGLDIKELIAWQDGKVEVSLGIEKLFRIFVHKQLCQRFPFLPCGLDELLALNITQRPKTTQVIVVASHESTGLDEGSPEGWSVTIDMDQDPILEVAEAVMRDAADSRKGTDPNPVNPPASEQEAAQINRKVEPGRKTRKVPAPIKGRTGRRKAS